ncbi:hypothetical protein SLA2020_309470 [Shorea laevis]
MASARVFCVVIFLLIVMVYCAEADDQSSTTARLIVVDQSGKGDYRKIQDAIDAVPSTNTEAVFILVKPGVYNEKIVVPADKPFITISGTKASDSSETVISWNDSGDIFQSPTLSVLASDFSGRYLTIQNTYGAGARAVALRVSGDKAAFFGCRILSYQDALLDDIGRHYYSNCYIEGAVDFIFGNANSLFEKCHLHSLSEGNGAITAQRRQSPSENTGFIFLGCKITGVKSAVLGRPWGAYSRVVFIQTYMSNVILPQGWDNWGDPSKERTVYYAEYKCFGPGAKTQKRVTWSKELTGQEAQIFMTKDIIGGNSWIRSAPTRFKGVSTFSRLP